MDLLQEADLTRKHSNVIYHLQKLKQPLVFDRIPDTGQRYFAEAEASLRQKWTMYAGKRGFVLNWIRKGQQSLTYIPDVAKGKQDLLVAIGEGGC